MAAVVIRKIFSVKSSRLDGHARAAMARSRRRLWRPRRWSPTDVKFQRPAVGELGECLVDQLGNQGDDRMVAPLWTLGRQPLCQLVQHAAQEGLDDTVVAHQFGTHFVEANEPADRRRLLCRPARIVGVDRLPSRWPSLSSAFLARASS
jgi:hypothetical protein